VDRKHRLARRIISMPYIMQRCPSCNGYISDFLLECMPADRKAEQPLRQVMMEKPGGAVACPYCSTPIGFPTPGKLGLAQPGWPIYRYSQQLLEMKRESDGAPEGISIQQWALEYRLTEPGSHKPFENYRYAEQAGHEVVPGGGNVSPSLDVGGPTPQSVSPGVPSESIAPGKAAASRRHFSHD
jgi:hypothetical protein